MSKELEDLEKLISVTCGGERLLANVKKALTPPTEEEVCEALSEWLDVENIIHYGKVRKSDGGFYFYNEEDYDDYIVEYDEINKTLLFTNYLPINLITMIGRFYESESERE